MQTPPITDIAYVASLAQQLRSQAQTFEQATQWAWWLLEKATTSSMTTLIARPRPITMTEKKRLNTWIEQICTEHKPIAYILGSVGFGPLEILVEPPILIPRPETELWASIIATEYQQCTVNTLTILDIGTGSGCIALLLAKIPNTQVTGIDINPQAVALAQRNANRNKVTNAHFLQSNLFAALNKNQPFDCIVSNPPYIPHHTSSNLQKSVRDWEDQTALFSEASGLAHVERIIKQAPNYLRCSCTHPSVPQKQLCIEIDHGQADKVVQIFTNHGYIDVVVIQDQYQRDRVVCALKGCFCPKKGV